jgi:hypothetical protein
MLASEATRIHTSPVTTPLVTSTARASMFEALRGALAEPGIRRIEVAWAAGIVADWAYLIALLVVAYRAGGALGVGILGVVRMVPAMVLGPLAATPIRRLRGERALLAIHAVRAGAALLTALVLAVDGPLPAIYLLAAVVAGAGALVRPIQIALLPAFAKTPGELVASNVASSTGEGVGTFVGPLLGGAVVALAGPGWACALVALVGFVAAGVVAGIRAVAEPSSDRAERADRSGGGDGRGPAIRFAPLMGVRALADHPGAAFLVTDFVAQTFVRGLLITLVVVASIGLLGLGEAGIGLLNGAMGAGGLAGGLLALGLAGRSRLAPAFTVALVFWGLPIAAIGLWPVAVVGVVALFVTGVSNAVLDVSGFTLLQRSVPNDSRLAVFGLFEGLIGVGVALGSVTAPVLLGVLGPQGALVATGAILPILAVVTWPRISRTDSEVVVPERQLALLRSIPFFAPLPMTALERLAGAAVPVAFAKGETLMAQGEAGDRFIVIESGAVDVVGDGRFIRACGPGNGIGEIALLRRVPRTATAIARSPVTAYAFGAEEFLDAVAMPASAAAAALLVQQRLASAPS